METNKVEEDLDAAAKAEVSSSPDTKIESTNNPSSKSTPITGDDSPDLDPIQQELLEHGIRLVIGTWNVNNQQPCESLRAWLDTDPFPDIYVIGLQEMDLTAYALMVNETKKADHWEEWITISLTSLASNNNNDKYVKIASKQLVGIQLLVFVKQKLLHVISDVETAVTTTGVMGVVGNKGGVAVRLRVLDTVLCFVNAHLAAHDKELERRNQDYADILRKTLFSASNSRIEDCNNLFWLGDLNYRINLPSRVCRQAVVLAKASSDWSTLFANDQLAAERSSNRAFGIFSEGPINFPPTFKYDVGTDIYDTSSKFRVPSWTDRIMWRTTDIVGLREYGRRELYTSDHKPVIAVFQVPIGLNSSSSSTLSFLRPSVSSQSNPSPLPSSSTSTSFDSVRNSINLGNNNNNNNNNHPNALPSPPSPTGSSTSAAAHSAAANISSQAALTWKKTQNFFHSAMAFKGLSIEHKSTTTTGPAAAAPSTATSHGDNNENTKLESEASQSDDLDLFVISEDNYLPIANKCATTLVKMALTPVSCGEENSENATDEVVWCRKTNGSGSSSAAAHNNGTDNNDEAITVDIGHLPMYYESVSRICLRASVVVDAPPPIVIDAISDLNNRVKWDDSIKNTKRLQAFSPETSVVEFSTKPISISIGQRHMCVLYSRSVTNLPPKLAKLIQQESKTEATATSSPSAVWVVAMQSVSHPLSADRRMQIRGHIFCGGFVVEPNGTGRSTVRLVLDMDGRGIVSPQIAHTFVEKQFSSLSSLRRKFQSSGTA